MKTKDELRARATGMAEAHFFCDDECTIPWEPFENWDEDRLFEQVEGLADAIYYAMLWAQENK